MFFRSSHRVATFLHDLQCWRTRTPLHRMYCSRSISGTFWIQNSTLAVTYTLSVMPYFRVRVLSRLGRGRNVKAALNCWCLSWFFEASFEVWTPRKKLQYCRITHSRLRRESDLLYTPFRQKVDWAAERLQTRFQKRIIPPPARFRPTVV